jgi:hypothetical protein
MLCPNRYAAPENSTGMNGSFVHVKNWRSTTGGVVAVPGCRTACAVACPTTRSRKSWTTIHW